MKRYTYEDYQSFLGACKRVHPEPIPSYLLDYFELFWLEGRIHAADSITQKLKQSDQSEQTEQTLTPQITE